VDAELDLQGSSFESIRVDFPGVEPLEEGSRRKVVLGSGAAKIQMIAGDDLIVTSRADEWKSLADFDSGSLDELFERSFDDIGRGWEDMFERGIPGIPGNLHERISEKVHKAEAAARARAHGDRAQRQVEAAMRRAEEKMRAAERRSQFISIGGRHTGGRGPIPPIPPIPPVPPIPPAQRSEPVSDEERLTILKMLQEKKISLQDAEKLLAALEGK
jgi:hypothetical protein